MVNNNKALDDSDDTLDDNDDNVDDDEIPDGSESSLSRHTGHFGTSYLFSS